MDLSEIKNDRDLQNLLTPLGVKVRTPTKVMNYDDYSWPEALIKVSNVTHEVIFKDNVIAIFSFRGMGTTRGYIVGSTRKGRGNHDLDLHEVQSLIEEAKQ